MRWNIEALAGAPPSPAAQLLLLLPAACLRPANGSLAITWCLEMSIPAVHVRRSCRNRTGGIAVCPQLVLMSTGSEPQFGDKSGSRVWITELTAPQFGDKLGS